MVVVAAPIVAGIIYWLHARHFEGTNDIFIDGYITQVAPRVPGGDLLDPDVGFWIISMLRLTQVVWLSFVFAH